VGVASGGPSVSVLECQVLSVTLAAAAVDELTSSLSGKPKASATIDDLTSELALLSVSVRRCAPIAVAVVTQLDTQPLEITQAVEVLSLRREGPLTATSTTLPASCTIRPLDVGSTQCPWVTALLTVRLASCVPSSSWPRPTPTGQHAWRDASHSSGACSNACDRTDKNQAVTRIALTAPGGRDLGGLMETDSPT